MKKHHPVTVMVSTDLFMFINIHKCVLNVILTELLQLTIGRQTNLTNTVDLEENLPHILIHK